MKIDKPEYADLRRLVEETTGRSMQTPKDFDLLVLRIYDRTNVLLSVSTLKRFWGYVAKQDETRGEMRRSTLNTLATYIGYTDWEAFCKRSNTQEDSDTSNLFYGHKQLTADKLQPGDTMTLMWNPDRLVKLRYSGNDVFLVTESKNSKLAAGDSFKCHAFVEHQPLTLIDLVHKGMPPCGYTCGKVGGIRFLLHK